MKKIFCTLVMCLAVATMASAEVTVSGALYTGFETSIKDDKATSRFYNSDKEKASRLDLDFTYKGETTGFKGRLRTNDVSKTLKDANAEVNYAFVYMNAFDNLLTLRAGKNDKGSWKTKGDEEYNFTEKTAVVLELSPLSGLNFGIAVGASGTDEEISKKDFSAGASYKADIFSLQGGFKFDGNAYAGLTFNPLDTLSIIAEAKFFDLDKDKTDIVVSEEIEYAIVDNFSVGVVMYQMIKDEDFSFKPYVVYGATSIIDLSLTGFYEVRDEENEDEDQWYIRPGVSVKAGKKTTFELFYKYGDVSENTIQLDAVIKF